MPLLLLFVVDGTRGIRQLWPIALATGGIFAMAQYWCSSHLAYELNPGTLLIISGVLVTLIHRYAKDHDAYPMTGSMALSATGRTLRNMRVAIMTVATVLALSYVMNQSGQTVAIGTWLVTAGGLFALLSPILGRPGTAVTGSDTSANALFANLRQTTGQTAGMDPTLLVAANTSGGVVAKPVSPQNLTITATAVQLPGSERVLLRKVAGYSVGMLAIYASWSTSSARRRSPGCCLRAFTDRWRRPRRRHRSGPRRPACRGSHGCGARRGRPPRHPGRGAPASASRRADG